MTDSLLAHIADLEVQLDRLGREPQRDRDRIDRLAHRIDVLREALPYCGGGRR
jgi:hypothetical protein